MIDKEKIKNLLLDFSSKRVSYYSDLEYDKISDDDYVKVVTNILNEYTDKMIKLLLDKNEFGLTTCETNTLLKTLLDNIKVLTLHNIEINADNLDLDTIRIIDKAYCNYKKGE